jgi:hypothetical protein
MRFERSSQVFLGSSSTTFGYTSAHIVIDSAVCEREIDLGIEEETNEPLVKVNLMVGFFCFPPHVTFIEVMGSLHEKEKIVR